MAELRTYCTTAKTCVVLRFKEGMPMPLKGEKGIGLCSNRGCGGLCSGLPSVRRPEFLTIPNVKQDGNRQD